MGGVPSYKAAATQLLASAWNLDAHLSQAVQAVPNERGADYFLDLTRIDWSRSREIFLSLREQKEANQSSHPLLSHASETADYVSHITTNLLPMTDKNPRFLATVSSSGRHIELRDVNKASLEWSILIYMGLSPFPLFGDRFLYDEGTGVELRRLGLGLGIFAYLSLALRSEIGKTGTLPAEIAYEGSTRPLAGGIIDPNPDGTLILRQP